MTVERSVRGAAAGALAAGVWAAQQPLDKRVFGTPYDDVELLGKAFTRGREWPAVGLAVHMANGALFGASYAQLKPFLPGPPVARALACALVENFAGWGVASLVDRHHPAREELVPLAGNTRALAQATWRHALFGAILGILEDRMNATAADEPPPVPVASNGHGDILLAATPVAED